MNHGCVRLCQIKVVNVQDEFQALPDGAFANSENGGRKTQRRAVRDVNSKNEYISGRMPVIWATGDTNRALVELVLVSALVPLVDIQFLHSCRADV
jgi:hypothetical protein